VTVTTALNLAVLAVIVAEIVIDRRRVSAVKGTHQRYVYSTIRRILGWAVVGFIAAIVVTCFAVDHFYTSGVFNGFMLYWIVKWELRRNGDDDDWFNGRWKKIKNGVKSGLKKLAASLTPPNLVPLPTAG
jgi:hypothetical protein